MLSDEKAVLAPRIIDIMWRLGLLLVAACGCGDRDTCTTNGDCDSGHVCAGPEQGPFQCYEDCDHKSCASGSTCTNLTLADPLGGGATAMACFPDTAPHSP